MEPLKIAPRLGQRATVFGLSGVTIGVLLLGLVLPYVVGTRPTVAGVETAGPGTATATSVALPGTAAEGSETPEGVTEDGATPSEVSAAVDAASPTGPAAPPPRRSVPPQELRATDRGVSADSIKIGFIHGNYGGASPAEAEERVVDWIDYFNTQGGVLGRKFDPGFGTIDSLDPANTARRACLAVTENHESFVVVDRGAFREPLCVTEEHRAIFIGGQFETESYVRSEGRLVTFGMDTQRLLRNQVEMLHQDGTLAGKKIGIVYDSRTFSKLAVERGLLPQLRARGYEVAARTELSGTDVAQGQSQIPIEVARHRTAGVDFMFMTASVLYFATWTQEATTAGHDPLYAVSDISGGSNADMFPGWPSGVRAIGHSSLIGAHEFNAGQPFPAMPPVYAECEKYYEDMTGTTLHRPAAGAGSSSLTDYQESIGVCPVLAFIRAAGEAAGPDLTTSSFSAQVQAMTNLDYFEPPGAGFGPGKLDSPNTMRRILWQEPCPHDPDGNKRNGCMVPDGPFVRVPFLSSGA